jgi:hypothetical protein
LNTTVAWGLLGSSSPASDKATSATVAVTNGSKAAGNIGTPAPSNTHFKRICAVSLVFTMGASAPYRLCQSLRSVSWSRWSSWDYSGRATGVETSGIGLIFAVSEPASPSQDARRAL